MRFQSRGTNSIVVSFYLVFLMVCFASTGARAQNTRIFTSNTTISATDTSYEGWDITVRGCTVTINGSHTFASLVVENNGTVTHGAATAPGLNLTITGNCRIDQGSAIKADGLGYPAAQGPGAGQSGTGDNRGVGGGYGGMGTYGNGNPFFGKCYGSITEPTDFGSGGGKGRSGTDLGGAGGGALRLTVFGSLTVNGKITANGQGSAYGGGGSGGSIWITTQSLFGVGLIGANAEGAGYGGGAGGGGRIALYYTDKSGFTNGIIECRGGYRDDVVFGGAGTIYYQQAGTTIGDLVVDNSGNAGYGTQLLEKSIFANVVIKNGGSLEPPQLQTLDLTALGNITIEYNSKIHANGMGYPAAQGPGAGQSGSGDNRGVGGGHGGMGTWGNGNPSFGKCYGSITEPTDFGSGGGKGRSGTDLGGAGGGAIRLTVFGSLALNGKITANGQGSSYGGGGSGGSIWITTQSLFGVGLIAANAEWAGYGGGAGGGGRIAVYYTIKSGFTNGIIECRGGERDDKVFGGAGTIYYQQAGTTIGDLVVDNSGNAGYGTQLLEKSIFANVVMKNGGSLEPPQLQTLDLTALGNITIQSNSKIHANGMGYPATQGPRAGQSGSGPNNGGGGGCGGAGGQGYNGIPGGSANDPAQYQKPTDFGSGGGNGQSGGKTGGAGGGAIRLDVFGSLIVNGQISADGQGGDYAGAGSGGSIWITTQSLSGTGPIAANGGVGSNGGGGGGGGRIALYYTDKSGFTGVIQVNGGPGWKNGNAGTIHQAAVASVRLLSLSLNVNSLAGGQTGVGTVAISEAAPAPGVSIGLSSSNANALTVPSSVTIAEGQTIGTFIYTAKAVSAPTIATITASFGGVTQSAPVTVNPWMQSFSISPGSISGSGVVMGSITLYQAAPPTGLAVNLTCPDAGIQVPATVYVGPGKTTLNNIAITVGEIVTARSAVVTASFEAESRTFTLYLNPPGLQARSVSATPASTIGGNPATGVVILTAPAPAGGAMVALSCSDTSIATIPSFVLIGAGQMNGSFPIATKPVTTQQSAFIKASISNTVTTTLTVRLPGVSILSLVPDSVLGGEASMAIVTLEQKYNVPITVDVTSDKPQAAPTTPITIPAGQTIGVSVIETSAVTSTMTAAITATANGLSKTQNLTIQGDTSTTKYTMADVQRALSIACGFTAGLTSDMSRCNVVTTSTSALVIDLLDAGAIARKVAGLDTNP